ncbi:MAG TPA: hypothetical protein VHZ29_18580 [Rhizomicrobium sp.]|nr:hypothetical protein [Rhizomicrobium sp.]
MIKRSAIFSTTRRRLSAAALTMAAAAFGFSALSDAQVLPPDASATCTVPSATFAGWFDAGHPGLNGSVKPANSITFSRNPNCAFYAWSHQMFLWLTSPAPSLYGGRGRIFNSPVFYDVSVPDPKANNMRHLIPHQQAIIRFPLGTAKVGMDGLPVVIDRAGQPHEVIDAPAARNGNSTILVGGKPVEIGSITGAPGAKAVLLTTTRKPIAASVALTPAIVPHGLIGPQSRALLMGGGKLKTDAQKMSFVLARLAKSHVVERFVAGGKPVFVALNGGTVVDIDPVQAGRAMDVLLAQNGSVIFYQTVVNDVYAYFLTGEHYAQLPPNNGQFPTTQQMADAIAKYAATNGKINKIIVDPEALAIEAKMSWIEITPALPNPGSYITTQATIPVYDTTDPHLWKPASTRTATLALVGVHVVGSTIGHPEMLWSTFEHYGNTPLATYAYNNSAGTQTVTQSTAGTWLFSATGSIGPFNLPHADYKASPDIESPAGTSFTVSASDTLRQIPFGAPINQTPPNPEDATPAASNTELISLNNNIAQMMQAASASADVRNNYFQSGTTWTSGGASPTGSYGTTGQVSPGVAGNEVGTNYLTNSTMETYQQSPNNMIGGTNCFTCHTSNTTDVSHMYSALLPLF